MTVPEALAKNFPLTLSAQSVMRQWPGDSHLPVLGCQSQHCWVLLSDHCTLKVLMVPGVRRTYGPNSSPNNGCLAPAGDREVRATAQEWVMPPHKQVCDLRETSQLLSYKMIATTSNRIQSFIPLKLYFVHRRNVKILSYTKFSKQVLLAGFGL